MSVKSSNLEQACFSPRYSSDGYGCDDVVPRGYASLMDLCENNYIRFKKLVTDLEAVKAIGVSHVFGCQSIYLEVLERSSYTTAVSMTYLFQDNGHVFAEPNLRLRIYHDVKLIEVVSGHLRHGCESRYHTPSSARMAKWRLNRFLYKWLGYCLYLGHRITPERIE